MPDALSAAYASIADITSTVSTARMRITMLAAGIAAMPVGKRRPHRRRNARSVTQDAAQDVPDTKVRRTVWREIIWPLSASSLLLYGGSNESEP